MEHVEILQSCLNRAVTCADIWEMFIQLHKMSPSSYRKKLNRSVLHYADGEKMLDMLIQKKISALSLTSLCPLENISVVKFRLPTET